MESIIDLDYRLFFFINQQLRNPVFDLIMPYVREKNFWIPMYVLLTFYFVWRWKKYSWVALVGAAVNVLISDQLSSSFIKPLVHRLRPCNDPDIASQVHLLVGCGGGFSFISSHAANHFGLALFLIVLLKDKFSWIIPVALLWATFIAFAQVYVGVHYPIDVFCGALVGSCIGFAIGKICMNILVKKKNTAAVR